MRISTTLLSLTLVLSACSGGADPKDAGLEALQLGKHQDAADQLASALDARTPADADYVEVCVAKCQALAHIDADKAKGDFLQLAESQGEKVVAKDFSMIVSDLYSAKQLLPAIDVLDAGLKRFPDDTKLAQLKEKVVAESQKSGDPAALEKLKGLGYL